MKLKLLTLIGATVFTLANDIEKGEVERGAGVYFHDYILKGDGEECKVTYYNNAEIDSTTCTSSTNSKGVKIYCTKTKKMCKTQKELDDFVTISENGDTEETRALIILKEWSKATNDKDMDKLSQLYAKKVTYYGKEKSKEACIKDKKKALSKFPDFFQRVEATKYLPIKPNVYKVLFDKNVIAKKSEKFKRYPSYLVVNIQTSKILVEGDDVSDGKSKAKEFDNVYTDSDGVEYLTTFNKNGAVMKSENGTLYLGIGCDASYKNYHNGEWEWANAGFEVRFKEKTFRFGGELLIENDFSCGFNFYNKETETKKVVDTPKSQSHSACEEILTPKQFNDLNPYKAVGKCVKGEYKIRNVMSETEAFAYDLKYQISPYTFKPTGEMLGDKAVLITAEGNFNNNFRKGAKVSGVFKITGTDKVELVNGEEITVNLLTMIAEE